MAACGEREGWAKIAPIASVIESCRRLALPFVDYLLDVLPELADRPKREAELLTPAPWAARRAQP